jgi:hypothetical protein
MLLARQKIFYTVAALFIAASVSFACDTAGKPSALSASYNYTYEISPMGDNCYSFSNAGQGLGCSMRCGVEGIAGSVENLAGLASDGVTHFSSIIHQIAETPNVATAAHGSASTVDGIFNTLAKTASSLLRIAYSFFSALGSAIWLF